jgi:signal transduction histidine kinase
MKENNVIRIHNIPLLDWAVYLTLIAFTSIAFIFLDSAVDQAIIVIALIAFGLMHILGYRRAQFPLHFHVYFVVQTLIVAWLQSRFPASDLFGFLFFILAIQVMVALSTRIAVGWVLIFFTTESIGIFFRPNSPGLIEILFNISAYFMVSVFAYTFREAEIARRQNHTLLEELRATQLQLQELAVTEERTRLARELHDSLGHQLTVAVVQLEGAQRLIPTKPERASEMIGTMRNELKNALADLRRTVTALRGPIAEDIPLKSALLTLTHSFEQNTGLVTHFNAAENVPELSEPYHLAIYRAAQEGLTNIQRHADAKNAWVNLSADDQHITLTIRDDGKGLDESNEKGLGVGLIGLGERASQLGGEMRFTSKPEAGGTTLSFILPLSEKRKPKCPNPSA